MHVPWASTAEAGLTHVFGDELSCLNVLQCNDPHTLAAWELLDSALRESLALPETPYRGSPDERQQSRT